MPDIVEFSCELGPDAPLAAIVDVVGALGTAINAALALAAHQAAVDADRAIGSILRNQGPRGLLDHARTRELPAALVPDEYWEDLPSGPLWYEYYGLLNVGLVGLSPFDQLVLQCQADELAQRTPVEPIRLRSLDYENPLHGELLVQAGVAFTGVAFVLGLTRDWSSRRRREAARARAEEQIQAANAADVQDQVRVRAELRQLALARIARGELDLPEDLLREVLTDGVAAAIDRLAERELTWDHAADPTS